MLYVNMKKGESTEKYEEWREREGKLPSDEDDMKKL